MIVKLKNRNIADTNIQWVVAFLTDRNQFVKIGEKWSFTKIINRSIVQRPAIGPTLFIICITDLKPIGSTHFITMYADDSSILVPEKYDVDLSEELRNVHKWAEHNKMQVNMPKQKKWCFTGQMPELSYFLLNCLALKEYYVPSCWVFGCRSAGGYGHEEA